MDGLILHSGKGHDDNPPGRGSGRYPWGSGKAGKERKRKEAETEKEFSQGRYNREFRRARVAGIGFFSNSRTDKHVARLNEEIAKRLTQDYKETLQFFKNLQYYKNATLGRRMIKGALKGSAAVGGALIFLQALQYK